MPRNNSQVNSHPNHFQSAKMKKRTSREDRLAPARVLFLLLLVCFWCGLPVFAAAVPEGFTVTQVATGMISVTRMALLPDGRILVCEQSGKVRVIENGVLRRARQSQTRRARSCSSTSTNRQAHWAGTRAETWALEPTASSTSLSATIATAPW